MSPEAEAVGLAQSWNSLSDPAVPMVKGREEEEEFYKFLPANTADRLWQSLSNPAKRHSFVSN